ncbi:MAG: response regulator transcription factor [Dehalococcoidia bacterium]
MTHLAGSPIEVRILIADTSAASRHRVREVFDRDRWFNVAGEVARPQELPQACIQLAPDVVFLGLGGDEHDLDGELARAALRQSIRCAPALNVIALIAGDSPDDVLEPVRAGAKGVLLRDAAASTLLEAVADVMAGSAALDPRLTGALFEQLAAMNGPQGTDAPRLRLHPAVVRALSPREQEVLELLARGRRNKEIAAQLGVSVGTVKTHLRHIYRKLTVADRTAAVLTALQLRLPEAA